MSKLNLGCGEAKLDDFINIDLEKSCDPDLLLDVRNDSLPFPRESMEEVWMLHSIEHIERKYWNFIFQEIIRVLKKNGKLVLAYPEFAVCAKNFLQDKDDKKAFWIHTLYGRQLYPGDYHVTPMCSPEMQTILESYGFYRVRWMPEETQDYNSILVAFKDPSPMSREQVIAKEILIADGINLGDI